MKAMIASAAALAAIAAAAPAAAQSYGYPYGNAPYGYNGYARGQSSVATNRIAQRIEMGFRTGDLTSSEARTLQNRLDQIRQLEWRYGSDGYLSPSEAQALDRRFADLDARLYAQLRDNDRTRYGYNDRYGYSGDYYGYRR